MPLLGLGTCDLRHHTHESVTQALAAGYQMIDTSGDYHTQRGIGDALRHCGLPRESIFVVTKVEATDDAFEATRVNLAELRLDLVRGVNLRGINGLFGRRVQESERRLREFIRHMLAADPFGQCHWFDMDQAQPYSTGPTWFH
jgi:aryl-alcohol dehydrogenase-like predicted oxidoreductase